MEKPNKKFYLFLAIAGIIVIGLIVVVFVVLSSSTNPEDSTTENQLPITDLSTQVSLDNTMPSNINNSIISIVSSLSSNKYIDMSDIKVRKDSIFSKYTESTNVHYGNFIIDIPSLKQSYFVQYEWSDDNDNSNLSGYPVLVTCLRDESKIIYPDFKCKDIVDMGF